MLNRETIRSLLENINKFISENQEQEKELEKANFCKTVLDMFYQEYENWSINCPFSIKITKEYLNEKYINYSSINDEFYLTCARFLREYILSEQRKNINFINDQVNTTWSKFKRKSKDLVEENHKSWLDYILEKGFDIDVLNNSLGNKSFQAFLNYEERVTDTQIQLQILNDSLEQHKGNIDNILKEKEERVQKLSEALNKQEKAFNFVGLSQGFENLLKTNKSSKCWTLFFLFLMGAVLLITPLSYVCLIANFTVESINDPYIWKLAIPFVGLEIILFYFFRVILSHYNSIKTQIMQIELRQSLCQFIQSYADYTKEIKENNAGSLEKFENLIFSNILSTPEKVPSTFDGLEQLANLMKELKK